MNARTGDLAGRGPLGPKNPPMHDDDVRQSARGEECTLRLPCCNWDNETTVFAHLRMFGAAGIGQKPADYAGVYGCHACHDALDGRNAMTAGLWGFEDVMRALMETHRRLAAKGLLHIGRID